MLPLANRRILITRPKGQSSALAALLEAQGATPILIPSIEIAPPTSFCALDAALTTLRTYDLLIFTSANAPAAFAARARHLNLLPYPKRLAAIGPATAAAIQAAGLQPDDPHILLPPHYIAESLAEALLPHAPNSQMLLVRAAHARHLLPQALTAAGATVTIAEAYRTILPPDSIEALRTLFATHPPDAITFTSASTAENLATLLEAAGPFGKSLAIPPATVLASIGPITSKAMRALGLPPTLEAPEATLPALAQALQTHFTPL